jgi:2-iminobutanoate/2-iminopropanoate deaminase
MSDIVSLVHYATDIKAFMGTGDIRAEFCAAPYPITTIQRLYHADLMIEVTAVAEIPHCRFHLSDASPAIVDDSRNATE